MDQVGEQAQRPKDVQSLELRWTNKAICQYCKILSLNESIASYAFRAYQRLYEFDIRFQKDRHAVRAASIFLACRYFKKSIKFLTILKLVRVNPDSGFIMLLSAEIVLHRHINSRHSGLLRMPEYLLASNAPSMNGKSIGLVDGSRVIVTSDYNESDPPMLDFCWSKDVPNQDIAATQAQSGAKVEEEIKDSKYQTTSEFFSVAPGSSAAKSNQDTDWNLIEYEDLAATEDSSDQWNTIVEPAKPTRTWAGAIRRGLFGSTT